MGSLNDLASCIVPARLFCRLCFRRFGNHDQEPQLLGHDERYPKQAAYCDKFKDRVIPDDDAALAALREGKIDIVDEVFVEAGTGNGGRRTLKSCRYRFHPRDEYNRPEK